MKKFSVICSALFAFTLSAEVFAQTRGPRYNPGGGGSRSSGGGSHSSGGSRSSGGTHYNPPSRSGGSSRSSGGTHYSPSSRPSSGSSSGGTRYNPPSRPSSGSSSSEGTHYNPPSRPSTGSSSGGTHYNPPSRTNTGGYNRPVITGPRYNPPVHQRGTVIVRRPVTHVPRTVVVRTTGPRYMHPHDYYSWVNRRYIYRRWIQEPVVFWYNDGYWDIGGYPYYVYRGFRYRYDPVDLCQYELVDSETYTTVKTFPVEACTVAYDACAIERDTMNRSIGLERYFCAEAVDKDQEQSSTETYSPSPVDINEAKQAQIRAYLADNSVMDIFRDGRDGLGHCKIERKGGLFNRGNAFGCKFVIKVDGKAFPEVDESVCSDDSVASQIDCNIGNERHNAGCIMQKAVQAGYCL